MVGLGCQMNEFRHDSPEVITDGSDLDYRHDVTERPVREIDLVLMYRVGWGAEVEAVRQVMRLLWPHGHKIINTAWNEGGGSEKAIRLGEPLNEGSKKNDRC